MGPDDQSDVFRFTLGAEQLVNLQLSNINNPYDQIILRDANGNQIGAASPNGTDTYSLKALLGAGTYYVQIADPYYYTSYSTETYTLTGSILTSPEGTAGSSLGQATALGALSSTTKSATDWVGQYSSDAYSFTLSSTQFVNLRLAPSGTNTASGFGLTLEDANGNAIAQGYGGFERDLTAQLAAGTYYVVAFDQSATLRGEAYTLSAWTGQPAFGTSSTDHAGAYASPLVIGALSAQKTYADWVGGTDPEDWYRFSLASAATVTTRLTVQQNTTAYLTIYASDGSTVYDSTNANNIAPTASVLNLAAGTFYIKVSGDGDGTGYSLSAAAAVLPDAVGTTMGTATALGTLSTTAVTKSDWVGYLSGSTDRTTDYYSFTMGATGYATLTLSGIGDPSAYFTVYDGNGGPIIALTASDSNTITLHPALAAGNYYVAVTDNSGSTRYTLNASETAIVDGTAGHSLATASSLGTLGATPVSKTDWIGLDASQDYYSFTLTDTSKIRFQTTLANGSASLLLLDSGGGTINSLSFDNHGGVLSDVLGPGTYYVSVANSVSGNSNYSLTASAVTVDGPAQHMIATAGALPGGIDATMRSISDWVGAVAPSDIYSFTLATAQTVNFKLGGQPGVVAWANDGTVAMDIVDDQGNVVVSGGNISNLTPTILSGDLAAGTYYVRLNGGSTKDAAYTLSWWTGKPTVGAATVTDTAGANFLTARDLGTLGQTALTTTDFIGQATGKPNDLEDMFKFSVSGLTSVQIELDLDAYVTVALYNASGVLISNSYHPSSVNGPNALLTAMLDTGVYYVDVQPFLPAQSGGYALTITGTAATDLVGHTFPTATALGGVGSNSVTRSDTLTAQGTRSSDVYAFSLGGASTVAIELSGLSVYATADLYDANGNNISSTTFAVSGGGLLSAVLGAGNYYIQLQSQGYDTAYNLTVTSSAGFAAPVTSSFPDSLSNARPVTLVGGQGILANQWVGAALTDQYYSFTVTAASIVDVATLGAPGEALLDANGNVIKSDSDGRLRAFVAAGTYYIHTAGTEPTGSKYDLAISTSALPQGTAGNSPAAATAITLSTTAASLSDYAGGLAGYDYYTFTLASATQVNIKIGGVSQGLRYDLLSTSAGFGTSVLPYGYSIASPGTDDLVSVSLAAGTYELAVWGDNWTPYTVTYNTGAPAVGNVKTDNAGSDTAHAKVIGTLTATPHINTDWIGAADPDDYFQFTVSALSQVTLTVAGGGSALTLYNSDGSYITTDSNYQGYQASLTRTLAAGTYYADVSNVGYDNGYSLSSIAVALPNAVGKTSATATSLGTVGATAVTKSDWFGAAAPDDYYKVVLAATSTLNVDVLAASLTAVGQYSYLEILDSSLNSIGNDSDYVGGDGEGLHTSLTLAAGTYYIHLNNPTDPGISYTLSTTAAAIVDGAAGHVAAAATSLGALAAAPVTMKDWVGGGSTAANDYYSFTLSKTQTVLLTLGAPVSSNFGLQLLDSSLNQVGSAYGYYSPGTDGTIYSTLGAGTYYVRVSSGSAYAGNYTLSASVPASPDGTAGHSLATATALNLTTLAATPRADWVGAAANTDVYSFSLAANIYVTFTASGAYNGGLQLNLMDANGNSVYQSNNNNTTYASTVVDGLLASGNYYLQVQDNSDTPYTLSYAAGTPNFGTATSPAVAGATLAAAKNLGTLGSTATNVSEYFDSSSASEYYKFTIASDSTVSLVMPSQSYYSTLAILDINGTQIEQIGATASSNGALKLTLAAGTYYIRTSGNGYAGGYALSASATATAITGNRTFADALSLGTDPGPVSKTATIDRIAQNGQVYYSFVLTNPTAVDLSLTGLNGSALLHLLDANGNVVDTQGTTPANPLVEHRVLAAGAYVVAVESQNTDPLTYTLGINPQAITVGDVSVVEGDSGTKTALFTLTLATANSTLPVTVNYQTLNGTAIAGSDYVATSGTVTFAPGQTSATVAVTINGDAIVEGNETFGLKLSGAVGAVFAGGASTLQATGTIVNDDVAVASIGNASVVEGDSGTANLVFTVQLTKASATPITFAYATSDGTATAGSDYTATSGTLTIAAGATSGTINVAVTGDHLVESNETFGLTLSSPNGASFAGGASTVSATGTITNDDTAIATIGNVSVVEGDNGTRNAVFTVSLSNASSTPIILNYATSDGTATAGSDYTATSGSLTIAAGATSGTISVPVIGDTLVEGNETFALTLSSPIGASFPGGASSISATGTITNDDTAIATVGNIRIVEGDSGTSNAVFTVSLNNASASPITIAYATADGTATAGSDYTATSGTLTIAAGATSGTISVPVIGDTLVEGDETFALNLSSPNGASFTGGASTIAATGTITNDDTAIATVGNISVVEGNSGTSNAVFTVLLSNASTTPVTIAYTTADGTATAGSDYTATSGTVTIAAGATSGTISIPVIGDTVVEGDETFGLTLSSPSGASFAGGASTIAATGTIINDDSQTATIGNASVVEGNSGTRNLVFTVSLNSTATAPVLIAYATSDGTATAGSDYAATSGTLVIAAGASSGTISVPVVGDTLVEANETFGITLSSPSGVSFAGNAATISATGTIINDDTPIVTIGDVSVVEGNSGTTNAVFTVSLSNASTTPVTIAYATANGTAASNDYTVGSGTLTIAAGATSGTITVAVKGDTQVEADETFLVKLSSPSGASFAGGATTVSATGTILNDDTAFATINNVSIAEGNSGTSNAVFTVTLSNPSATPITLAYATADGTATAGSDYTATSGTLTFAAGARTGTISVPIIGDTVFEPNETFGVTLSSPVGASFAGGAATVTGTGTITNDDTLTASVANASVAEGDSGTRNIVFTVSLSSAPVTPVTIAYATADGTATAGSDYAAVSGTLVIAAGATSGTISVPVVGDTLVEGNETFALKLTSPSGATFAGNASTLVATGTITNDDTAIASIGDVTVAEGNSGTTNAVFTVSLSNASATPVTIAYATANGTAASNDYTVTSGTLTIAAGATSGTISVAVKGDTQVENNETFLVKLSSPVGASFAGGATSITGTGTILNDDTAIATIGNVSIAEGNSGTSNAVFTVTLSNPSANPITFAYATSNGTATAGSDYTATSGTLTIAAGARTGTISVPIIGDTVAEDNETFGLTLSSPNGASFAGAASTLAATGTITNDDIAPPALTVTDASVTAGGSLALSSLFTVTVGKGDSIATYQVMDTNPATSSGTIDLNGVAQPAGGVITISAAALSTATFVAGTANGQDTLFIKAIGAAGGDSGWSPVNVSTVSIKAPTLAATVSETVPGGSTVAAASLASINDNGGAAISEYQFLDLTSDPKSGSFLLNSTAQPAGQVIDLMASAVGSASFRASSSGVSDQLWVRVTNGTAWSNWSQVSVMASAPATMNASLKSPHAMAA